jgi:hypothetical protein
MNRRNLMVAALVAATSWPVAARAQQVEHGRGDINAIDLNRGEVELKDPQGKVRTWRFERDASVKVSDDSRPFTRNPTTADLRPPMYVHYTYVKDVIQTFDIIEIRAAAGNGSGGRGTSSGNSGGQAASPRTVVGRVTAYDPRVRQVEVDHDGKRETFQLTTSSDRRLSPGDRVQIRTEWSGSREQVAELRIVSHDHGR